MRRGDAEREVTVDGVIVAEAWDDDYNLVGARIVGAYGEEYLIAGDFMKGELLELVHERLRVRGTVKEDGGRRTVVVKEWEVLDE